LRAKQEPIRFAVVRPPFQKTEEEETKIKTIEALLLRHSKIAAVVRGEWSPQPRVTQSHSIFNSNKQNIEGKHGCLAFGGRAG